MNIKLIIILIIILIINFIATLSYSFFDKTVSGRESLRDKNDNLHLVFQMPEMVFDCNKISDEKLITNEFK